MYRSRLTLALVLALLQGCSLVFVEAPPAAPPYRTQAAKCTTSLLAPGLDAAFTGYEVLRTGLAISRDDSDYADIPISREADIGLGVGFGSLFLGSSIYGFVMTARCKELKRRLRERIED